MGNYRDTIAERESELTTLAAREIAVTDAITSLRRLSEAPTQAAPAPSLRPAQPRKRSRTMEPPVSTSKDTVLPSGEKKLDPEQYAGVKRTKAGKWEVNCWDAGKQKPKYLGTFPHADEAALASANFRGKGSDSLQFEEMIGDRIKMEVSRRIECVECGKTHGGDVRECFCGSKKFQPVA